MPLNRKATKTQSEREDDAWEGKLRSAPQQKPPRHDLRKAPKEKDPDLQGLGQGDGGDPDLSRNYKRVGSEFSRYISSPVVTESLPSRSRSPTTMPKLSPNGVKKMTAEMDRIASTIQDHHTHLGLPKKVAMEFARICDHLSDHLEKRAGLRRKAQFDPTQNFTESEDIPNRFDAAEIGMESDGPIMKDPDEPYMDVFNQDEFDQLREVQQTGMFSNAKVAARTMRKLADLLAARNVKVRVVPKRAKKADEDEEFVEEEVDEEMEDEDEDDGEGTASKKRASNHYRLFG